MKKIFNFSAGPAMLPQEVLSIAKKELKNWNNLQTSVMEISHRSEKFIQTTEKIEESLRNLLNISKEYAVLFCQGGARGQFSAIPLNLLKKNQSADYIVNGYWSFHAMQEAKKYCLVNNIDVIDKKNNIIKILPMKQWKLDKNSSYVHYCPNETISGIAIKEQPICLKKTVVADFSSTILSRPINVNNYGIIYASAQKNIGPSGITLIIIKKKLINQGRKSLPSIFSYKILEKYKSMFNTPPTFSWYLAGLVFKWIEKKGGLKKINIINKNKSKLLYNTIDNSNLYYNNIFHKNRSDMNIHFNLINKKLENIFIQKSFTEGFYGLKGHKILGGIRASIYNAMTLEGVKELVNFMIDFEKKYG